MFLSRSRSHAPTRREHSVDCEDRRSRSPSYSPRSKNSPPPSKGRKHSLSPDGSRGPQKRSSRPAKDRKPAERNGSDYSGSPKRNDSRSPMSQEREGSPAAGRRYRSPEANGRSRPSPRDHVDADNNHHASRGSDSPQD